jgi:hypothetical protein
MKRQPLPERFELRDDFGRAWPPGFRSQLLDPDSPHALVTPASAASNSRRATEAREQAAREGKGWANGTIESLAPAGYTRDLVPVMGAKPFRFKPSSIAERAYVLLRDRGAMCDLDLRKALLLKQHELRPYLTPAIKAGVIQARRVEANRLMFEVGKVVEVTG